MSAGLDARPVKLTDGRWAVMVNGVPAIGDEVVVTTLEGERWQATITEVGDTDETTGEVVCLTARGPSLPDATPAELAERQQRAQVWMHRHREAVKAERRYRRPRWMAAAVVALWALAAVLWCA